MWQLFWDTIGYFADNVSKSIKIIIFALLIAIVYFFGGVKMAIYFAGGIFWISSIFMIIAAIVISIKRSHKKKSEAIVTPLSSSDQADIREFQEAMEREIEGANPDTAPTLRYGSNNPQEDPLRTIKP